MAGTDKSNWNKELEAWVGASGKTPAQISDDSKIPRGTLGDYISGRITNLDKISPERLKVLYELTGLEVFYRERVQIKFPDTPKEPTFRHVDDGELAARVKRYCD